VTQTCGARSTVNIDRSMVNTGRVSNGPWWARVGPVWAGLTQTRGKLWRCHVVAVGLHWAVVFGYGREHGSRWTKRRWSMDLGQGPWWTESIVISPRLGSCAPGVGLRCSTRPLLCFFHGMLPPATCSPVSSRNGSGVQLRWGKASPCHGDYNGGVRTTDGAS